MRHPASSRACLGITGPWLQVVTNRNRTGRESRHRGHLEAFVPLFRPNVKREPEDGLQASFWSQCDANCPVDEMTCRCPA